MVTSSTDDAGDKHGRLGSLWKYQVSVFDGFDFAEAEAWLGKEGGIPRHVIVSTREVKNSDGRTVSLKRVYRCNGATKNKLKCPKRAGCILRRELDANGQVVSQVCQLFLGPEDHVAHDVFPNGVADVYQGRILELYFQGMRPKAISETLQSQKRDTELSVPTYKQVNNFIQYRKSLAKKRGIDFNAVGAALTSRIIPSMVDDASMMECKDDDPAAADEEYALAVSMLDRHGARLRSAMTCFTTTSLTEAESWLCSQEGWSRFVCNSKREVKSSEDEACRGVSRVYHCCGRDSQGVRCPARAQSVQMPVGNGEHVDVFLVRSDHCEHQMVAHGLNQVLSSRIIQMAQLGMSPQEIEKALMADENVKAIPSTKQIKNIINYQNRKRAREGLLPLGQELGGDPKKLHIDAQTAAAALNYIVDVQTSLSAVGYEIPDGSSVEKLIAELPEDLKAGLIGEHEAGHEM